MFRSISRDCVISIIVSLVHFISISGMVFLMVSFLQFHGSLIMVEKNQYSYFRLFQKPEYVFVCRHTKAKTNQTVCETVLRFFLLPSLPPPSLTSSVLLAITWNVYKISNSQNDCSSKEIFIFRTRIGLSITIICDKSKTNATRVTAIRFHLYSYETAWMIEYRNYNIYIIHLRNCTLIN